VKAYVNLWKPPEEPYPVQVTVYGKRRAKTVFSGPPEKVRTGMEKRRARRKAP
jgi:hypothetical protein